MTQKKNSVGRGLGEYLPDLPKTVTREIHEHEILLSFNGDEYAELFLDWWHSVGNDNFAQFVNQFRDNK